MNSSGGGGGASASEGPPTPVVSHRVSVGSLSNTVTHSKAGSSRGSVTGSDMGMSEFAAMEDEMAIEFQSTQVDTVRKIVKKNKQAYVFSPPPHFFRAILFSIVCLCLCSHSWVCPCALHSLSFSFVLSSLFFFLLSLPSFFIAFFSWLSCLSHGHGVLAAFGPRSRSGG